MPSRHPQTRPDLPGNIPTHIWRDGRIYYSMPELARRRGHTRQAVSAWAHRHPEHTFQLAHHIYAEDHR